MIRGLIERFGLVEGLDVKPRLPCEGNVRCGVGRESDGADRLGVGWLGWLPLLLAGALRCVLWASAAEASSNAATKATATAIATELDFFFVNITDLLSPAIHRSGYPETFLPHHRRHAARLLKGVQLIAIMGPKMEPKYCKAS